MARVLYSAAMSLDGFIAGPDGDMSWLTPHMGPNPTVDALVPRIGALLVGRRTFDGDDPNRGTENEGAFGGAWVGPQFVLTHTPPPRSVPGTTFVTDLRDGLERASAAAGDGYVNVLGATVARQCLDAGAVDEILVTIVPVLLGDGVPLYRGRGGAAVALETMSVTQEGPVINVWMRVVR